MDDLVGWLVLGLMALVAIALAIQGLVWVIVNFWVIILLIVVLVVAGCLGGYWLKEEYKVWRQAEAHKREVHAALHAEDEAHDQIEATYQQVKDEMTQVAREWDER